MTDNSRLLPLAGCCLHGLPGYIQNIVWNSVTHMLLFNSLLKLITCNCNFNTSKLWSFHPYTVTVPMYVSAVMKSASALLRSVALHVLQWTEPPPTTAPGLDLTGAEQEWRADRHRRVGAVEETAAPRKWVCYMERPRVGAAAYRWTRRQPLRYSAGPRRQG